MIAGPVLSPCSFHSSWSCAALRQGHPASRDQLTGQEQCEAAKRITTRGKILSIDGPKAKRQNRSGFQGRQSGPPQWVPVQVTVTSSLVTPHCLLDALDTKACGLPDAPVSGSVVSWGEIFVLQQMLCYRTHLLRLYYLTERRGHPEGTKALQGGKGSSLLP